MFTQEELNELLGKEIRKVCAADKLTKNDLDKGDMIVRLAKQFTNSTDITLRTAKLSTEHKSPEINSLKDRVGI